MDEKHAPVLVEKKTLTVGEDAPPMSAFATWTRAQCIRKFWRLYLSGLGACVAGL